MNFKSIILINKKQVAEDLNQSMLGSKLTMQPIYCLGIHAHVIELLFFSVFFNVYSFLRDRVRVGEGQRERETESEAGSRL